MSSSPIGGAGASTIPAESVDEGLCCSGRFIMHLEIGVGRSLRGGSFEAPPLEAYSVFVHKEQGCCK